MHDTHTTESALITPTQAVPEPSAQPWRTRTTRTRLMPALCAHWTLCSLLMLALQLTLGLSRAVAEDVPGSGSLVLHLDDGHLDALVLDATMDVKVQGLLAELTLRQSFRNTTDQWVQGSYLFPLPPEAAVRGLQIHIGERIIDGNVEPRADARKRFDAATDAGQIASLVEQQRPNLFTMRLANIAPGERIDVTLDVMLPIDVIDQRLQLTLPTTLTPRYTNQATPDTDVLDGPIAHTAQIRGPRLNVQLSIAPLSDYSAVSSPAHTLQRTEQGIVVNNVPMDQDLVISWPLQLEPATRTHAFIASHDSERYVQLLINPPATLESDSRMIRELILIVDKSGSMAGVSMDAAVHALHFAIDGLNERDYLNIIAFDDQHHPLFARSQRVSKSVKHDARRFANSLQADGGTEMGSALAFALDTGNGPVIGDDPDAVNPFRQIVFMTDGSVGYEEQLLTTIQSALGDSRLFTVGIGPAPNTWFLQKAAEAGRGVSLSILDEHDVARSITDLLTGMVHPVLTDIAVQYPQGSGELYPRPIPDLYAERPGMWVARISTDVDEIVVTGRQHGQRWRQTVKLPGASTAVLSAGATAPALEASAPALAMYWTRSKIDALMDEQRYAADRNLHKDTITQLARSAGLVTRYTSFVAVEAEPVRPINEYLAMHKVVNLIPKGNQMGAAQISNPMQPVAMPRGAAGVDTLSWLSGLLGISGLGLLLLGRRAAQVSIHH